MVKQGKIWAGVLDRWGEKWNQIYIMLFNKYETVLLWDLPDVPDTFSLTNSVILIACGNKLWRITVFSVVQSLRWMFKGESKGKRKY